MKVVQNSFESIFTLNSAICWPVFVTFKPSLIINSYLRVGSHPECQNKFRSNCGLNDAQFAAMLESLGVTLEEKNDNVDNELLEKLNEMKMEDDEGENSLKVA